MTSPRIAIVGDGRMGRTIERLALDRGWSVVAVVGVLFWALVAASETAYAADINRLRERLTRSVIPDDPVVVARLVTDAAGHARSLLPDHTWKDVDYADQRRTFWGDVLPLLGATPPGGAAAVAPGVRARRAVPLGAAL